MTYLQILWVATVFISLWLGKRAGYHNGYIAGRRAVRKHYEQVGR